MGKKKKQPPSAPSKAYLVSFGDTMTALLAFFIVINSLAKEQTGANMYSGTGSFVTAIEAIGFVGAVPSNRSRQIAQKEAQSPIYALAENLDKNPDQEGKKGPDDEHDDERKIDRDKENYQRFLHEMKRQFGLVSKEPVTDQVVFDSFELFKRDEENVLSDHAIQLAAEIFPLMRDKNKTLDIVIWASMPSPVIINKMLVKSEDVKAEIERKFPLQLQYHKRIRYSVKPWLFSDAKRPVLSFVVGTVGDNRS